ncbi:MAG: DUF4258 domain-containing protein [Lentisphaerae bacterium]|nr:DUF4258 domain-containing protein [Lentisphaerota bacterium]
MSAKFRYSLHAREELLRRSIPQAVADEVLRHPEQIVIERASRKTYQSRIDFGDGKVFLVRVIVDDMPEPPVVVTAYRTSKIQKYWRQP